MVANFIFAGFSGSGKTTVATKVIKNLSEKGFKIAALKHDGHNFEMDKEGKDTYLLKQAGARCVAISSASKYALISDCERRLSFLEMLSLVKEDVDLAIGEGFKGEDVPKIIVHRKANNKETPPDDKNVLAVITDEPQLFQNQKNIFGMEDIDKICKFIEETFLNFATSKGAFCQL